MALDGPRPICKEIFSEQRRARAAAPPFDD
jgi:hypothetical protein